MSNINQLLKAKREALMPQVKYPCECKRQCERFGGALVCDCDWCYPEAPHTEESWDKHLRYVGREDNTREHFVLESEVY